MTKEVDNLTDFAEHALNTIISNLVTVDLFDRWSMFETDILSFDLPEGVDIQNPFLRSILGISEGRQLHGSYGDRMSALFVIDAILTIGTGGGWGAARSGAKLTTLGDVGRGFATLSDDVGRAIARAIKGLCNSFSANTKVAAAAGAIAISSLAVGQEVYAYNETTGEVELQPITATHVHDDPVIITLTVDLDLSDDRPGEIIETTPEHPFYVLGEWVNGEDLEVGMPLSTFEGTDLIHSGTVTGVEREERVQTMYNLTVAEAHTFFVGEGEWLVHNQNGIGRLAQGITLYHYTDAVGAAAIQESGMLLPDSRGRVFLTPDQVPTSYATDALFAGNPAYSGKGSHVVTVKILPQEGLSFNPSMSTQYNELVHSGTIRNGVHVEITSVNQNSFSNYVSRVSQLCR